MIVTRFAPSPTGFLHLGHAFSAWFAYLSAEKSRGRFLVRIEDIDQQRCKSVYRDAILDDLTWLGLPFDKPVREQSRHYDEYKEAVSKLKALDLLYPCFCSRREILAEVDAASQAPHFEGAGIDGPLYPGTCRDLDPSLRAERLANGVAANWRLDMGKALQRTGPLRWNDRGRGTIDAKPETFGDAVIARKDIGTTYHLSVTVDDFLQGVTLVTRGDDLLHATDIHRLLQQLLGYPTPDYHHHALMKDASGKRYAKRDKAPTLRALREAGTTASSIKADLVAQITL